MVSWRNPLEADEDGIQKATWDDYLEQGVLQAIAVTQAVSGQAKINALGFCVGGTMLATSLAIAAARGQESVASVTLLTSMIDFGDTGVLGVFVDPQHVRMREQQLANGGLMSARELGTTFSFLRPNELVWNYVVANYLKGEKPPAFDLLYWNSDSTNLPGPFFTWYFRNTYLENNLCKPQKLICAGETIDFSKITIPAYLYGSREDHIVPWVSAYASTKLLAGENRFVLGASGHIAGVINPPAKNKRSYWVDESDTEHDSAENWLAGATEYPGSWWSDWARQVAAQPSKRTTAAQG
jgi:polyhydroxyalkanoate synthase